MEKNLSLQNQLKATRIIIDSLKDKINDYDDEILRLNGRTLTKACMGAAETRLYAESRYEIGFEDCRLPVTDSSRGESTPASGPCHNVGFTVSACKPGKPGARTKELRFPSIVTFYFLFLAYKHL